MYCIYWLIIKFWWCNKHFAKHARAQASRPGTYSACIAHTLVRSIVVHAAQHACMACGAAHTHAIFMHQRNVMRSTWTSYTSRKRHVDVTKILSRGTWYEHVFDMREINDNVYRLYDTVSVKKACGTWDSLWWWTFSATSLASFDTVGCLDSWVRFMVVCLNVYM